MEIRKIKLSEFEPAPYNPRIDLKPGDNEYEKLIRSIEEFGCIELIVVNIRTKHILSGHQRVKVLKAKGIEEVDGIIVDFTIEKEKAANLALNKIRGNWDENKLALLIDELSKIPDFDLSMSGFDMTEVSEILDGLSDIQDDHFNLDEEIGNIEEPITKQGDLIVLGKNRLLCGNSANPEDVKCLIEDCRIDLIFTDPPYNVNYYGGNRPSAETSRPKSSRNWLRIYNDNLTQEEYESWLSLIFANATPYLSEGAPF